MARLRGALLVLLAVFCAGQERKCKNNADIKVIAAKWETLQESITSCGTGCLGAQECIGKCVSKLGLSSNCASCYGEMASCAKSECTFSCGFSPRGSSCARCVLKECTPQLVKCTGLTCDEMPHCSPTSSRSNLHLLPANTTAAVHTKKTSSDPTWLPPLIGPPLPRLPNQFTAVLEANIMEKGYTAVVHEAYDIVNNRAFMQYHDRRQRGVLSTLIELGGGESSHSAVEFHLNGTGCASSALWAAHAQNQNHSRNEAAKDACDCTYGEPSAKIARRMFVASNSNAKSGGGQGSANAKSRHPNPGGMGQRLRSTAEFFQFGCGFKEEYLGRRQARGILCDAWVRNGSIPANPFMPNGMTYQLIFYFSSEDWKFRAGPAVATDGYAMHMPVRVELASSRFNHYYDFVDFAPGPPDPELFRVGPGISCAPRAARGGKPFAARSKPGASKTPGGPPALARTTAAPVGNFLAPVNMLTDPSPSGNMSDFIAWFSNVAVSNQQGMRVQMRVQRPSGLVAYPEEWLRVRFSDEIRAVTAAELAQWTGWTDSQKVSQFHSIGTAVSSFPPTDIDVSCHTNETTCAWYTLHATRTVTSSAFLVRTTVHSGTYHTQPTCGPEAKHIGGVSHIDIRVQHSVPSDHAVLTPLAGGGTGSSGSGGGSAPPSTPGGQASAHKPHAHAWPPGIDAACTQHKCAAEISRCESSAFCDEALHCAESCKPFSRLCARRCALNAGLNFSKYHAMPDGSIMEHSAHDNAAHGTAPAAHTWLGGNGHGVYRGNGTDASNKAEGRYHWNSNAHGQASGPGQGQGQEHGHAHGSGSGGNADDVHVGGAHYARVFQCVNDHHCLIGVDQWGFGVSSACIAHQCATEQSECLDDDVCHKEGIAQAQSTCVPVTRECVGLVHRRLAGEHGHGHEHEHGHEHGATSSSPGAPASLPPQRMPAVNRASLFGKLATCMDTSHCFDESHTTMVSAERDAQLKSADERVSSAVSSEKDRGSATAAGVGVGMLFLGALIGAAVYHRFLKARLLRAGGPHAPVGAALPLPSSGIDAAMASREPVHRPASRSNADAVDSSNIVLAKGSAEQMVL